MRPATDVPTPLRPVKHVIYLHGFASSPASSKAQRFGRGVAAHGVGFTCPDLNEPSFESLTITRMLVQTAAAIAAAGEGPIALVGSSLGAFVAAHAAARHIGEGGGMVDRLVLMAPAFDFGGNRLRQLGAHGVEEWRRRGSLPFYHHAHQATREVGFALYEDAARYDAHTLPLTLPALVFQGTHDASVDPAMVRDWCATREMAELHLLDDDHQLAASTEEIWARCETFFGLTTGS
jgi:uncharacterized protein